MILQTIRSRDRKYVFHGVVTWRTGDEFGFVPQGRMREEWWCKADFWELIEGALPVYRISA